MLKPRETDLPGLFLVFVVLPLVAYVLLGKWSEVSKKKEQISVLSQIAAEEAFQAEAMAAAVAVPLVPVSKSKSSNGIHECARCFGPATTRCSRCKSVRYCSGKCQIIHWRQVHKHECQPLEYNSSCASPKSVPNEATVHEHFLFDENLDSECFKFHEKAASDESPEHILERSPSDNRSPRKFSRGTLRTEEIDASDPSETACSTSYDNVPSKESFMKHKPKRSELSNDQHTNAYDLRCNLGFADSIKSAQSDTNAVGMETEVMNGWSFPKQENTSSYETKETQRLSERSSARKSNTMRPPSTKMHKSTAKVLRDQQCSGAESTDVSRIREGDPLPDSNRNKGFLKIIGLKRSSKHNRVEHSEVNGDKHKKLKMLFPYEEFVKYFQYEVDLLPRGLVNCGNSCYANAVLQCLSSTKPLTVYMLRQSHSRACRAKNWCLMCELEQHVLMLQESGEPLSLSRILLHIRGVNGQIGGGSQEDAHEFLRLLLTSMQSICLEGLGGEDVVDPKLQETTFIQHTFGGQLRSKVKCLRCHHESDRYENFMDLTLEIFGWVESLEDALTQFTSPEDLDGENMYRCGRCAAYVRARKQLAIQEAPNILTVVLKRFQEGSYGKINKCISFADILDMIPFMTGTHDIPPLYMLYGVVVHLDTMNASFSGHYVSYVKDLRGNWFRIDDAQVHPVPLSQVMSEGAYILFYMRSSPRPPRNYTGKPTKNLTSKASKSTKDHRQEATGFNQNLPPIRESYAKPSSVDFPDASSDWSIFTSSDDASFTTESTRDSFSTVDSTDNTDPVSSIFNTFYASPPPEYVKVSFSRFSRSRPHTRFMEEEKRPVLNSYQAGEPPYRLRNTDKACCSSSEAFAANSHCGLYMKIRE